MKRFAIPIALMVMLFQALTFSQEPPVLTRNMGNGRFWDAMNTTQRGVYLRGAYDGIYSLDRTQLQVYFPMSLTLSGVCQNG